MLADVPTLDESGLKGFNVTIWHGMYAPKGTPKAIIARIKRMSPARLSRFDQFVPLDRRVDYLSLRYGVKFQIPFELMVVFSTNLDPADLADEAKVATAVRALAAKLPTYITLKDVKKRWGHGQEDIFPVAQFEKLWSDMTALPEVNCKFIVVPRLRGQLQSDRALPGNDMRMLEGRHDHGGFGPSLR